MLVIQADRRGLLRALRDVASLVVFAGLPLVVVGLVLRWTAGSSTFLSDFHGDLYSAGKAILGGHDPYRDGFLANLAAVARAGGHPSTMFAVPVYPAPDLLVTLPLALLPYRVAAWLFTALAIGAFCLGLRLLGVRDWRCYGCAFLGWPLLHTLRLGQVNEFLVLAAACGWRWRDRMLPAALAVATAVVAKLFLWPLGLFFVLTRRWRTLMVALAAGGVAVLGAWAVIGFDGFSAYPRMLSNLSQVEGKAGISLLSWAAALGVAGAIATAVAVVVTVALVALAWRANSRATATDEDRKPVPGGLRSTAADGERAAYGLLVLAGIASSSLVWPHYLVLLYVPIALMSPSLGPLWLVPLIGYLAPVELTHRDLGNLIPWAVVELLVAGACVRPLLAASGLGRASSPAERPGARRAAGRLLHGLRSTRFRSNIAAQRPTEGP